MAITTTDVKATAYSKNGTELRKLLYETIGEQVKLTKQNGINEDTVQLALEAIHTKLGTLSSATSFKGVINAEGEIGQTYGPGDIWFIGTDGTYKGRPLQKGDMIFATVKRDGSGSTTDDFQFVQGDVPNPVSGPVNAVVDENVAVFDGTTGTLIKDSTLKKADLEELVTKKDEVWTMFAADLPQTVPTELKENGLLVVGA